MKHWENLQRVLKGIKDAQIATPLNTFTRKGEKWGGGEEGGVNEGKKEM